jgi:hypothetical protein
MIISQKIIDIQDITSSASAKWRNPSTIMVLLKIATMECSFDIDPRSKYNSEP